MAKIATSIELYDKVSKPISQMVSAISHLCSAFDSADASLDSAFDTAAIQRARNAIEMCASQVVRLGEETDNAEDEQKKYNRAVQQGASSMDGLIGKVGGLVTAYASMRTVGAVLNLSDEMTQSTARLGMLVEGEEELLSLQDQIFQSAQSSRGSYQDMANTVAKLGMTAMKSFSGTEEIVKFTELLNKQLVIGGASASEQAAAMYQLTQAMASGRLQGDEYRSIIENAPLLAKAIEDYMVNVKGATGTMKEWAAEGLLTADVIKAAMFNSADDVEQRFANMPMTWGQMWTMMKNQALTAFQPVLQKLSQIVNSPGFQTFVTGLLNGLTKIAGVLLWVIDLVCKVAEFFSKNWSVIEPIVWGIVAALGAYYTGMFITNTIIGINTLLTNAKAAADAMATGTTFAATAAQYGYNAALYACPLVWIIALVIALIAVIYILCDAIAKLTGVANSGFGMICGGINVVIAFFWNLMLAVANIALGIWNAISAVAHNIYAAFWNAICSVQSLFWGLLQTVMEVIEGVCKELNKIPFVEIDYSGISNAANDYASKKAEAENSKLDYKDIGAEFDKGFNTFDTFESGWVEDAYNTGAKWGDGVANGVSDFFGGGSNVFDSSNYDTGSYDASQMPENAAQTAENTGAMADSMEISNEDLKYLRDITERETINRFTTAEIKVDMTNNNNVSSNMDLDGMVDYLVVGVNEAMVTAAEGVHV